MNDLDQLRYLLDRREAMQITLQEYEGREVMASHYDISEMRTLRKRINEINRDIDFVAARIKENKGANA